MGSNKGKNKALTVDRARELPDLHGGTEVFVTTGGQPTTGRIIQPSSAPRSYIVGTPSGSVRRNRSQLNVVPDTHSNTL